MNHQKRIFDRKEASFTGQGFCNRLKTRLTVVFAVNLSPLEGFWEIHILTESVGWWLNGALVRAVFKNANVRKQHCTLRWSSLTTKGHELPQIVLSVSAGWIWRFEVCCRQSGNVSSQTITSGYTRRKTEFVPSRKLFGISSTLPPPHWGVCSHHYQCSYSLSPLFLSSCE